MFSKKTAFSFLVVGALFALVSAPTLSSTTGDAKKGQDIFESLTCVDCHKGGGNSVRPSKPLKGEAFAKKYPKDGQIEKIIRKGVPNASMPGFNTDVISVDQMKDLIAYLRSLTPTATSKTKGKSASR